MLDTQISPTRRVLLAFALVTVSCAAALAAHQTQSAASSALPLGLVGGYPYRTVVHQGETFFKATAYNVAYASGQTITLASHQDGTGDMLVDDVLTIKVTRPDGSTKTFKYDSSLGCSGSEQPLSPTNVTNMFLPGNNTVAVTEADKCGGWEASPTIYLVFS
jgi:hypothetical protein